MIHKLLTFCITLKSRTSLLLRNVFEARINLITRQSQKIGMFIALTISIIALVLILPIFNQYRASDPQTDGYVPPRNISKLVEKTQASTVTIYCEYGENSYSQGSGWSIKLRNSKQGSLPTSIITNQHVIDECLNGKGKVSVVNSDGHEYKAIIDNWDRKNDLAVLATNASIPPLRLSKNAPWPGYWTMAVGTADGYAGSVAFGNVLNVSDLEILITANISHGNSGGPLIDNEGYVIGTNSWGAKGEQYNGAKALDSMCEKIIKCKGKYFWPRQN